MEHKRSLVAKRFAIAVSLGLLGSAAAAPALVSAPEEPRAGDVSASPQQSMDHDRPLLPHMFLSPNASGLAATYSTSGQIDRRNPFFQDLGTNGRSCATCHQQSDGWTVIPSHIRERFERTAGTDPIFRLNDGANAPNADVSTLDARRKAYSMLLSKGLIRVGIGLPENAEFELVHADDPYGFASAKELSLFRRPLPSTNLKFLSTVMWDGRETFKDANSTDCILGTSTCFASIHFDLADQANAATIGHAQASQALTTAQREAIANFETSLFTAQVYDHRAKSLTHGGALGGPRQLAHQEFHFGMNDVVSGDYRTHAAFTPNVFDLYASWHRYSATSGDADDQGRDVAVARRAVARGEQLFNTRPIEIRGVKGLNDDLRVSVIHGTCTTCHDTPHAGSHSIPAPLDIGLTDATRRSPDLPLYTLRNKVTGETIQTTDPGRALITGKWQDIGRFKGPILRALAARAPYFHNGSAPDLAAVVEFYNERFGIGFTEDEQADLVAFLRTL